VNQTKIIKPSWKDCIFNQRTQVASMLREPLASLANKCASRWNETKKLNAMLVKGFASIPYCSYLYAVDKDGMQISDNINSDGVISGNFHKSQSDRSYMKEVMPDWGFLLSDSYISLDGNRPSLTALQVVNRGETILGYLAADFDLRKLPVTSALYIEPENWRQVKGDPAIRGNLFQQSRCESPMDGHMLNALSILEELILECGIFQCQIHFSSSQITIWTADDPLRYRILDQEAINDADICLLYPSRPYPDDAAIPQKLVSEILKRLQALRTIDTTVYLRTASINIFNGMLSLTFSCDGTHYMHYDEFLDKGIVFWSGLAA
jgi:hypothetical protein